MNRHPTIFLVKESRQQETRVALVPEDAAQLIQAGYQLIVEADAGGDAGFSNQDYELIGAHLCRIRKNAIEDFRRAFKEVDIILRVKRPDRLREQMEAQAIVCGTKMIGSLDLLERNSSHVSEYQKAGIDYYSFDDFFYPPNSPMQAIKEMSVLAGKLALKDALQKIQRVVKKVVVLGYGAAGRAIYDECRQKGLFCLVISGQFSNIKEIQAQGMSAEYLDRQQSLPIRQEKIQVLVSDADIVIACAATNREEAPILIPNTTLFTMQPGTVVVDLAVSEGGNVEGSRPDATMVLGNEVLVTNVSGYPKAVPREASILWSKASLYFINMLVKNPERLKRRESS